MDTYSRILVRATNWIGDAVMSLPALAAVRRRYPAAHIAVLARPWVADLYRHEPFADEIIPYTPSRGLKRWQAAGRALRAKRFECAVLLQNAFDAAAVVRWAGIPRRIGYRRDGRGWLLTDAVPLPKPGSIPPHESYYYLELLRRIGWVDALPDAPKVRLEGADQAREAGRARFDAEGLGTLIGVSPGAAYGSAKRWLAESFIEASARLAAELRGTVALFGSAAESELCEFIRSELHRRGFHARSYAGATGLAEYIERAAACRVYLTNDSGAMHIASALGVPTVAVFGSTNPVTTGPASESAIVMREEVECSPCMLRECPFDHACMKAVTPQRVARAALDLLQREGSGHAV